jgi:hypothetical protein
MPVSYSKFDFYIFFGTKISKEHKQKDIFCNFASAFSQRRGARVVEEARLESV